MGRGQKNEEIICKIKELLLKGLSYSECAREVGVSRQRVHQICTTNGLIKKPKHLISKHLFSLGNDIFLLCKERFVKKAARSTYTFEVEFDDIEWPDVCPVLGIKLDYLSKALYDNSPTFDRIDNNLGYVKGNVKIISKRANRIKSDATEEELRLIADYIKRESDGH